MKYFTPKRYAALQDFSNDGAMNAADAAWEEPESLSFSSTPCRDEGLGAGAVGSGKWLRT